jgi:phosphopantetheinyl transferase
MNVGPEIIFNWPEIPTLPPPGKPVLIRVATASSHQTVREELRDALRRVLATWSGLSPGQLLLSETLRGPVWSGPLGGHPLDISLSYAEGGGWIGLVRAGLIGVDAMQVQQISEAEEVARHYLGQDALATIQQSDDPAMTFALAWTELEARLKCLKQELSEWSITQASDTTECAVQSLVLPDRLVVTVATSNPLANVKLGAIEQ